LSIKKLASQTLWYGVSSIAARFIGYLITPLLTYSSFVKVSDFGRQSLLYAAIPVLSVLFTYGYGIETAFFRFSAREEYKKNIFSTAFLWLFFSTVIFSFILWHFQITLASWAGLSDIPQVIQITILIVAIDTLSAIPFARLRQEERPRKYALVKVSGIVLNLCLVWFFISFCPNQIIKNPQSWVSSFFDIHKSPIIYIVLANLFQNILTLLLLSKEISFVKFKFDTGLWKEMMLYAMPLVVVGLGGFLNEVGDRLMLRAWLPGSAIFKDEQVGIYSACYKLSLLITLFIQAFRMGAEPFFFKQSEGKNPQAVYARVMKFFVLVITLMFLAVSLFIPVWERMIGPQYRVGITVVPILLLANMSLGVYYNLSIWFKLSNKTIAGTYITLTGTAITLIVNWLFIPRFGYLASAWATFLCYFTMMLFSFLWGQKVYYVPYAWKKLTAYFVIVILLFFIHKFITSFSSSVALSLGVAVILTGSYFYFISRVERKEFLKIPLLKRLVK
jgi:O-antigen/teichoic acid export membrane protein